MVRDQSFSPSACPMRPSSRCWLLGVTVLARSFVRMGRHARCVSSMAHDAEQCGIAECRKDVTTACDRRNERCCLDTKIGQR